MVVEVGRMAAEVGRVAAATTGGDWRSGDRVAAEVEVVVLQWSRLWRCDMEVEVERLVDRGEF